MRFKHIFATLDVLKFAGILILLVMFIRFNSAIANNTKQTRSTSEQTNRIVKSQSDILEAIKQLAQDNKITSEQKANLIICMLQVPVEQRTTDTLAQCRKESEAAEALAARSASSAVSSPATAPATSAPSSPTPPSFMQQAQQFISSTVKKIEDLL